MTTQPNLTKANQPLAHVSHVGRLPSGVITNSFGQSISVLLPGRILRSALLNFFEQRASYAAIKSWRFGYAQPPQWAREIVDRRLKERIAAINAARTALAKKHVQKPTIAGRKPNGHFSAAAKQSP